MDKSTWESLSWEVSLFRRVLQTHAHITFQVSYTDHSLSNRGLASYRCGLSTLHYRL